MRRSWWVLLLAAAACDTTPITPPPPNPPQVFLIAAESVVAAPSLTLTANVSGCKEVAQLQLYQDGGFLKTVPYTGSNTQVTLVPGDLTSYYPELGIAIGLILTAKVVCDDGRSNTSTPVSLRYFPVASVVEPGTGPALPDAFVVEGGIGNTPATFVGCIGTSTGYALARVDLGGTVIAANTALPFACSYASQISERNKSTGHRWLLEPGVGAFAFDQNLNITSIAQGKYSVLGVAPDGDALIWNNKALWTEYSLFRVKPNGGVFPANVVWQQQVGGMLNATPVVDTQGTVYLGIWNGSLANYQGIVQVQRLRWDNGAALSAPLDLAAMEYGDLNSPEIPNGAFNASGTVFYFPFQTGGPGSTRAQSRVIACATNSANCAGGTQRWLSPVLDGVVLFALPFSAGTQIAAVMADQTYFLNESNGQVSSAFGAPVKAVTNALTHSIQPGLGTDFYILNGPAGGYPTEVVAVDSPVQGELWRFELAGGGEAPQSALYLGLDESGQAWLRVGPRQVKPLTLKQYRDVKGANRPPP